MPDDHSEVVPLLPIPNRTVKRLCADDSADSRVKVGHRQANICEALNSFEFRAFVFLALGCRLLKRDLRKASKFSAVQLVQTLPAQYFNGAHTDPEVLVHAFPIKGICHAR